MVKLKTSTIDREQSAFCYNIAGGFARASREWASGSPLYRARLLNFAFIPDDFSAEKYPRRVYKLHSNSFCLGKYDFLENVCS